MKRDEYELNNLCSDGYCGNFVDGLEDGTGEGYGYRMFSDSGDFSYGGYAPYMGGGYGVYSGFSICSINGNGYGCDFPDEESLMYTAETTIVSAEYWLTRTT